MELKDIDIEDIEDVLLKVEDSFGFRFADNEMAHVQTFGQLCNHINHKLQLNHTGGCTSQQAFYKLKSALAKQSIANVSPQTAWTDILPFNKRRKLVKNLEHSLGFKLHLIGAPGYVIATLALGLLGCLLLIPSHTYLGLLGALIFVALLVVAHKTGKEIKHQTVGETANIMAEENYILSRSKTGTFNAAEVEGVLVNLFARHLNLPAEKLTTETPLR